MVKLVLLALFLGSLMACGTTSKPSVDTSLPPMPTESIEGICRDWQLDSFNSEFAWVGYRAGLRPAPRLATPQEVAACRELGYLSKQEHCDAWERHGIKPPWIGVSATNTTIARSCRADSEYSRIPTLAPSPAPTTPEPTATPVAMAYAALAEVYERSGPEAIIDLLEGKRVQVEGVVASGGVGKSGFTDPLEFTKFSVDISED